MVRRYEHVVPSKYKRRLRLPGKPLSNDHLYETTQCHGHGHRAVLNTTHNKTLNNVPRAERLRLTYTECYVCVCTVSNATTLPTVKFSRINNISQKYVDGASTPPPRHMHFAPRRALPALLLGNYSGVNWWC